MLIAHYEKKLFVNDKIRRGLFLDYLYSCSQQENII